MKQPLLSLFYILNNVNSLRTPVLVLLLALFAVPVIAQLGPGGISSESGGDSNCKIWFNVGTLDLSDNSYVDSLLDLSSSAVADHAFQTVSGYEPIFRSDVSAGINGQPVLKFNDFQYFKINTSSDINLSEPHNAFTYVVVIRTSNDVESRQVVYEQGGTTKGLAIEIDDHHIYFSAHDKNNDGDGTPQFNPISVSDTILANHNYVYLFEFYGPTGSSGGFMRGSVNGTAISNSATGVGAIGNHSDDVGLGAINSDIRLHDNSQESGNTGGKPFIGNLAEFVMYNDTLNDAEQIILENYLGAKYGDDVLTNDKYAYEDNFAHDVIGIGQENGENHNKSQGFNIFSIQGGTSDFQDGEFLITGHNGEGLNITTSNIPNNSTNSKRVAREWRFDHTGDLGPIEFRAHTDDLPDFGTGFTKYVLIVDKDGGITSNYTGTNVEVLEMTNNGTGSLKVTTIIPDGAYATIGAIKPQATFAYSNDYAFETDANIPDSVKVILNYRAGTEDTIDYYFSDVTAVATSDYVGIDSFLIIPEDSNYAFIYFDITGDFAAESSESFSIHLNEGSNTSTDLNTGDRDSLRFSIYDNDNIPEVSFGVASNSFNENADTATIDVVRSGSTANAFTIDAHLRLSGSTGTAVENDDYTFSPLTLSFDSGVSVIQLKVVLLDDNTDEDDETIYLELSNSQGAVNLVTPTEFELTILDDDAPPTVQFLEASYFSPETFGTPNVDVVLSEPSDLTVTVEWERTGGTATVNSDYNCPSSGIITFLPGDIIKRIPIIALQDGDAGEPDETVDFELKNNANLTNASLGSIDAHEFTIKDYTAFEWTGPAGVGDNSEVALWIDASRESFSDGDAVGSLTNFSGTPVTTSWKNGRAIYNATSGMLINGMPAFNFWNDGYEVPNSGIISGHSDNRDLFIVFRTNSDVDTRQFIYEGGGTSHGFSIYIWNDKLYFYMWSPTNANGTSWGTDNPRTFVVGDIEGLTNYILHCKFDHLQTYGGDKIELSINGVKVDGNSDASINVHNGHSEHNIGRRNNGARWTNGNNHDSSNDDGNHFRGSLAECIVFQNSPVNNARKRLIESYLSAKYQIPIQDSINSTAIDSNFGGELAGIGQYATNDEHLDAQGYGNVRMNTPSDLDSSEYLIWHSNEMSVSDTISSQLPGCVHSRIEKTWGVSEIGDVGTIELTIDLAGADLSGKSATDFELLIHNDSNPTDFTNAERYTTGRSLDEEEISFSDVNLEDGDYFSVTYDVGEGTSGIWKGEVSTDWHDASNWGCEIPNATTDVTIPSGTTYAPQINNGFVGKCKTIEIQAGASLSVKTGGILEVNK